MTVRGDPNPAGPPRTASGRARPSWVAGTTITRIASDPHSPNEFRCNQVVKNLDAFHHAYGTTEQDPMWLAPGERVSIW